ncbi:MAG TPA: dihydropteroate synthase [Pirellulales bacterium]|jgi:dihydropteroate synthase|nr:dihydropteroate synthase [Pirellulales bacterium]
MAKAPTQVPLRWTIDLPTRATHWQLAQRRIEFPRRPLLMGIVNVTPDSFSDGGQFLDASVAIDRALELVAHGADILDIGGESTRPYSTPVDAAVELARVMPVLHALEGKVSIPISIDTSKAAVAREALSAGAEIINDITALTADPTMVGIARQSRAGVCMMHMQGTPQTMQDAPSYNDVLGEVITYLRGRCEDLTARGISRESLAVDPGIGFGKTHQHNLDLMAGCWRLHELGLPVLVGHSRKGFIGKVLEDKEEDRDAGTAGAAIALAIQGVQIIRVHNVAAVRQALLLFEASGGFDGASIQLAP